MLSGYPDWRSTGIKGSVLNWDREVCLSVCLPAYLLSSSPGVERTVRFPFNLAWGSKQAVSSPSPFPRHPHTVLVNTSSYPGWDPKGCRCFQSPKRSSHPESHPDGSPPLSGQELSQKEVLIEHIPTEKGSRAC